MSKKLLLKAFALAVCMNHSELKASSTDELPIQGHAQEQAPLNQRSGFKGYSTGQKPEFAIPPFSLNMASEKSMMQSFFNQPQSLDTAQKVLQLAQKCHAKGEFDLSTIIRDLEQMIRDGETSGAELWNALLRIQAAQSTNISSEEKALFSHLAGLGEAIQALTQDDAWKSKRSMSVNIFAALNTPSKFAQRLSQIHPYHTFSSSPETHHKAFEFFQRKLALELQSMLSIVPVLERGFVGFHFLIENLINDSFPIAFPSASSKLSAHGIEGLSPLGFTLHDLAHIELYGKRAALSKYGAMLFQKMVDDKVPYQKATEIAISRVIEAERLLKTMLTRALETIDQKAFSGEMSATDYAKALHGYFYLLHENPLFFSPLFECETFSDLLVKMGLNYDLITEEKLIPSFSALNPFNTSPIDGSTLLSDVDIVTQIMSDTSTFEKFKVEKYDTFDPTNAVDRLETKVHRSSFSIDVELHFENGNNVSFVFPTLRQSHLNALHSLHSLKTFWNDESIDPNAQDITAAYSNMAKITIGIQESANYFLSQINTTELDAFYTAESLRIQELFNAQVTAATPQQVQIISSPLHQEAPSSFGGYSPYVLEETRLRIENDLLKQLMAQSRPNISLKSQAPVEFTMTYGDAK